jgi:hypothetical protein
MIIHGRTMETTKFGAQPAPRSEVEIVGIWRTLSMVLNKSPAAPSLISIQPPLYADRAKSTPCLGGSMKPIQGDEKVLLEPAAAGATTLRLSDAKHLKPKDLLGIDFGDVHQEEVIGVKKIEAGSTADVPASVVLCWPLSRPHRRGNVVQRLERSWHDSAIELALEGHRGDACLFFNALDGIALGGHLRIVATSVSAPDEHHRVRIFKTKSDQQGFYQLPPLQRVAQVQLRATNNGKKAEVSLQPDYGVYRNQVDFVFKTEQTPTKAEANHA